MDKNQTDDEKKSADKKDESYEKGRRDAASVTKREDRDFPGIVTEHMDRGSRELSPMSDKRKGLKREQESADKGKELYQKSIREVVRLPYQ
ncbi:MAG: hypothetical protein HN929_12365 [Chloroflexi bacterium]|nr:hypothetical protein [Chloroflexota bacterium]MBT7082234.1 hypothetical protein [Chloroflexota bacterium]MBT7289103.1 hypothetical protein [Chloroflexota bacterium]